MQQQRPSTAINKLKKSYFLKKDKKKKVSSLECLWKEEGVENQAHLLKFLKQPTSRLTILTGHTQ